jgi:hypothetical protein
MYEYLKGYVRREENVEGTDEDRYTEREVCGTNLGVSVVKQRYWKASRWHLPHAVCLSRAFLLPRSTSCEIIGFAQNIAKVWDKRETEKYFKQGKRCTGL